MSTDELYMQRCIDLALLGKGHVAPNPMVGAVIVHEDRIIGEGYHARYGEAHAEVNAVQSVEDTTVLSESTIYVSLEPCAHFGKTPPCADLLVKHQFKRVVIGCSDSFDQVDGKGVQKLKAGNLDVTLGVLEQQCLDLNKAFFTFHEKKRPFIFLKWAQTPNGKIDQGKSNQQIDWISRPEIQPIVHQWRSDHAAILVGKNTVLNDNPSLTVRAVDGPQPIRIVLDTKAELSHDHQVFDSSSPTWVMNTIRNEKQNNMEYIQVGSMEPQHILDALYQRNVQSVMIEGGRSVLQSFIEAELWDEACVIVGQHELEEGTDAPVITNSPIRSEKQFGDALNWYNNS